MGKNRLRMRVNYTSPLNQTLTLAFVIIMRPHIPQGDSQDANAHDYRNGNGSGNGSMICYNCGAEGHTRTYCPQPGGGRGRYWNRNGGRPQHRNYNPSSGTNAFQHHVMASQLNANVAPFIPHHGGPYGHMNLSQELPEGNANGAHTNGNVGSHGGSITGQAQIVPADTADSAPGLTVWAPDSSGMPFGPQTAPFAGGAPTSGVFPGMWASPPQLTSPEYARTTPNTPRYATAPVAPRLVANIDPRADDVNINGGARSPSPLDTLATALGDVPMSSHKVLQIFITTMTDSISSVKADHWNREGALTKEYMAAKNTEKASWDRYAEALTATTAALTEVFDPKSNGEVVQKNKETALQALRAATEESIAARDRPALEDVRIKMDKIRDQWIKDLEKHIWDFIGLMGEALKTCDAAKEKGIKKEKETEKKTGTEKGKALQLESTAAGKGAVKPVAIKNDKKTSHVNEKKNDTNITAVADSEETEKEHTKGDEKPTGQDDGKSNGDETIGGQAKAPKKPYIKGQKKNWKSKSSSKVTSKATSDAETDETMAIKDAKNVAQNKDAKDRYKGPHKHNDSQGSESKDHQEKDNGLQIDDPKDKKGDSEAKETKSGHPNDETQEKKKGPQNQNRHGKNKKNAAKNKDTTKEAGVGKKADAVKTNEPSTSKDEVKNGIA
ncbi:hypothetical protein K491DRAFT_761470 [Lophiostoma macrostomum CBS 122681]|uniref:CCHC-type domain-containing protein n=1 Tax=Lophiostoma macrostomum CBS 122681 TaxID=1314788 RepID=A0A6A6STB7_9PLEO|nr:hypothetical protein K491DRAFT_761470 [Lophiostoma macrostomum CBS 122681]